MLESPTNTIELIDSSTRPAVPQTPTRVPDCGQTVAEDLFATVRCTVTPDAIPIRLLLTSTEFPFMLGRYEVLSVLGQGEMVSVYLVYGTTLDRRVAMKIPALDEDNHTNDNIQNEARVMAGLHHTNICPVHDFGVIDETPYLTMPFISGPTLSEFTSAASA